MNKTSFLGMGWVEGLDGEIEKKKCTIFKAKNKKAAGTISYKMEFCK
jgi:hypothetical protein